MKKFLGVLLSLGICLLGASFAGAETFDSNSGVIAGDWNYWPWGDADNLRYQLWFSDSMLGDFNGTISSITHFISTQGNVGAAYTMKIYASTTPVAGGGLSAYDLDGNHGANKTLIYDATYVRPADYAFTIDVDNVFNYSGSGNLLLDYVFLDTTGVGHSYDGPTMQAVDANSDFYRVTSHALEGNVVYDWGAIRTQINAVPEPASMLMLAGGLLGIAGFRRRKN
ncbi:MAG: PEP-CTERM sorting domain-containing protein [Candidatus Schekmanbacteria bacterium]|nr:PEP-CTERM sorting domain-containing protein [Candidatus Schekmanbacteria bacterium]